MMKKSTKGLSLILAAMLLVGILGGCGGSQTKTTDADAQTAETTETAVTESAESSAEASAEATENLGAIFPESDKAQLKFSNEYSFPLTDDSVTLSLVRSEVMTNGPVESVMTAEGITSYNDFQYIKDLEEQTGVHIAFTELNFFTMAEKMNIIIASGDYPDMFTGLTYSSGYTGALNDEVIVDLTDHLADWAPNYYYMVNSNPDLTSSFTYDGKFLTFSSPYESFVNNQGLVIRKDWLEEQGLELPETYDQLHDALTAFKDAYGCTTAIQMNKKCMIQGLVPGYDIEPYEADGSATSLPYYVEDGTVKCSLDADGFRDYLTMLNKWYQEGLFDQDFVSIEDDPFSNYLDGQISSNQMGVWYTSGEGINNITVPVSALADPVQNKGDLDHITDTSLLVDTVDTVITTGCENLETAMRWLDYFYSVDGITMYNYGIEDKTYTLEDGQPTFTDTAINNENGLSVANYTRAFCPYGTMSGVMLRYRTEKFNTDINNEVWNVWGSNLDGTMTMPDNVSLTTDETETESTYSSDLQTYALQMIPSFITGQTNLDQWDEYVSNLKSMGLDACIAVRQAAYDRSQS